MRTKVYPILTNGRIRTGIYGTDEAAGNQGAFLITGPRHDALKIIAAAGLQRIENGWEHVSVSCQNRCPTWEEMAFVKHLFWEHTECVVQFHPPSRVYVNEHPFCLHLWRDKRNGHRLPPTQLVGDPGAIMAAHRATPETPASAP